MSSNGNNGDGGDDRTDELIRQLRRQVSSIEELNEKLDMLVNSIVQSQAPEDDAEEITQIDQWDVGRAPAGKTDDVFEYIDLRRESAISSDVNAPRYSGGSDIAEFYLDVYSEYGEHLQAIYSSLSNDQFEEFIQRLAIKYGVEEELVDILDPGTSIFGVDVIRREVSVFENSTHMVFIFGDTNYWFSPTAEFNPDTRFNNPWDALGLPEPEDSDVLQGDLTPREMNSKLADAIERRSSLSLPDRYNYLL